MATFTPSTSIDTRSGKLQWRVRFVSVPHALLTHPTYGELTGGAAKLLLALLADYVGNNKGHPGAACLRIHRAYEDPAPPLACALCGHVASHRQGAGWAALRYRRVT